MIATCFALTGFAAAGVANLAVGNDVFLPHIWFRVMGAMLVCLVIGLIVGHFMQRTVVGHVEKYKKDHPIPDDYPTTADEVAADLEQPQPAVEPTE